MYYLHKLISDHTIATSKTFTTVRKTPQYYIYWYRIIYNFSVNKSEIIITKFIHSFSFKIQNHVCRITLTRQSQPN